MGSEWHAPYELLKPLIRTHLTPRTLSGLECGDLSPLLLMKKLI
jgi:hypothetical protein